MPMHDIFDCAEKEKEKEKKKSKKQKAKRIKIYFYMIVLRTKILHDSPFREK